MVILRIILLLKLFSIIDATNQNEVLGCGGFIKSHADIDFSKVEVKLFTKQGSLKDKTDCSPSNGYYFIPIYDKGDYMLKISPPPGWSFQPEQVEFNFDGKTDICSQGKDLNFVFKGFGITGKVALAGHGTSGARGVDVELHSEDGVDIRHTRTDFNGIFSFTPIVPGKYLVRASHPRWHLLKWEHTVLVATGNTVLPENSLVVSGFDVQGRVETNDQLINGIGLAIFRQEGNNLPLKCSNAMPVELDVTDKVEFEKKSICYTDIEKTGDYTFIGVAPGKYLLRTVTANQNLKLHIIPKFLEFQVLKDTLILKDVIRITGFSVSGRILSAAGGEPVPNAKIKLNGQWVADTDTAGTYILENINSGTYTLQVEAQDLLFKEQQIRLQPLTPIIPDINAVAYHVCGKVISDKSYIVGITMLGSSFHESVSTKPETGDWCSYLPRGKFSIEVVTTEADKTSGIQFYPLQQNVEVLSSPIKSGIIFSQLRATISGRLICLPDSPVECISANVVLHSLDAAGQPTGQQQQVQASHGKYMFEDILPGPYELTIPQSGLCFDMNRVLVNVAKANETVLSFTHRGYEVSIISSHRTMMKYSLTEDSQGNKVEDSVGDTIKLLTGVNIFCVPRAGSYSIKLEGCHRYEEADLPKTFSTFDQNPIMITAISHKMGVRVLSTEPNADLIRLMVDSGSSGQSGIHIPIAEAHKVDGKFAFRFDTFLKPDQSLLITPQSDVLLFKPKSKKLIGSNECVDVAFNFMANRGLIIRGKVIPPIKDVTVTLTFPENSPELIPQTVSTNVNGEFKFGPIDESLAYELKAEKDSYVFSDYSRDTATFVAHKLCEIIVMIRDESGQSLSGVLVSLSGAESYRKNLVTAENGIISFHSLSPSQYFLRPMMKEYKFEPNSKMVEIKDGETLEITLVGKRVAYSVFGKVTSLNGEPFGQLNIETTANEHCLHHQEEATSELNGQYRLRGLQPGCTYVLRPKDIGTPNSNVERCIPAEHVFTVENSDILNINLIAINTIGHVDVTVRVTASLNDQYKTLRLIMYRKGNSDSPIYSQRVESPLNPKARFNPGIMVFLPRIPFDHKTYVVELKSSLSDKTYTYTLPSVQFVANMSSVFVELDFKAEVRTAETDLNQNSISALILVALIAIAFFKQDIAMDLLNFVWTRINIILQDITNKQKNHKKENRKAETISSKEIEQMAEQINAIKKKKIKKI